MGRRSLPRVDKNIDLRDYLFDLSEMADSWTPLELFTQPTNLEVEVGSGKGLFLQTAAKDHPDRCFVGVEIAGKYARFAAAKLARQGLLNAKVLHGDAMQLFAKHLRTESVACVHVYFPDPWWKKRHFKRRIMNDVFLQDVQRTLRPHGELHFWTDVEEYFHLSLQQVRQSTQLHGPYDVEERPAVHDLDYHTHFERRMRKHNQAVYRSRFLKADAAPPR